MKESRLRTLMHPRNTGKPVNALPQTGKGGEKPRGSSGIANEQVERSLDRTAGRDLPVPPDHRMVRLLGSAGSGATSQVEPELPERIPPSLGYPRSRARPSGRWCPSAKAARISARLVMLLEPGTVISAETGRTAGTISIRGGNAIRRSSRYSGEGEGMAVWAHH